MCFYALTVRLTALSNIVANFYKLEKKERS